MPRRLHDVLTALTHALTFTDRVHFHAGDHGRPYVCEHRHCNSPALHTAKG